MGKIPNMTQLDGGGALKRECETSTVNDFYPKASFYTTKYSLTNFMCQMFFHHVNWEFLSNLSKIPNLHGNETFDN